MPWLKVTKNIIRYIILPLLSVAFLFGVYLWQKSTQPKPLPYISHMTSKLGSTFSTSISSQNSNSVEVGDTLNLTGSVSAMSDIGNLKYSWEIPPHLSYISGSLDGNITTLQAQKKQNFTITLRVLRISESENEIPVRFLVKKNSPTGGFSTARFFTFSQEEKNQAREEIYQNVREYKQKSIK